MLQRALQVLAVALPLSFYGLMSVGFADDQTSSPRIQEEVWALPLPLPIMAYVVRPIGDGPFPLVIMNHGVSLNAKERSFFPLVEFRDAAFWFARRGYLVVAPAGSGTGLQPSICPSAGSMGPSFPRSAIAPILISATRVSRSRRSTHGSSTTWRRRSASFQKTSSWSASPREAGPRSRFPARPTAGKGHHYLCGRPRRSRRWEAEQQLRARQTGGDYGRIRPHCPHTHAVDLYGERYILQPRFIQTDARGLRRRRRRRRIPHAARFRQRWAFPDRFGRRYPPLGTIGEPVSGQGPMNLDGQPEGEER
jgi:hypothetical protein